MGFLSLPTSSKPRKVSRKQKAKLAQQKEIQKKNRKSRQDYWKTAGTYVPEHIYIPERNQHLIIKDAPSIMPIRTQHITVELNDEMVERERVARKISEEMKKQTAPLYNKGPYQYIGDDPEIIKNLGKKI